MICFLVKKFARAAKISQMSLLILLVFTSCAQKENMVLPVVEDYYTKEEVAEKKDLRLGVVPGPYGDMFLDAIAPTLEKKGYTVDVVVYDDYVQPNIELAGNKIDLNMFQHYTYLNNFKFQYDLELSSIVRIPTVSMCVYSAKYKSIRDIEYGATVSIPNDSTNRSRALSVLDAADIVTIDPSVDKSKATEHDLVSNPYGLQFFALDANILAQQLSEYDLSVINGNFAYAGGLKLSDALYAETLTDNYINVIAVRAEDLDKQFVKDIISAVHSEEFIDVITDTNGKYVGFQRPRDFLKATWE